MEKSLKLFFKLKKRYFVLRKFTIIFLLLCSHMSYSKKKGITVRKPNH